LERRLAKVSAYSRASLLSCGAGECDKLNQTIPVRGASLMSIDDTDHAAGIMLVETEGLIRKIPSVLESLGKRDQELVLSIGQDVSLDAEQPLWRQGDVHQGIYLISQGWVRTFYLAPSGREVTLAYWFPGNFVGSRDQCCAASRLRSGHVSLLTACALRPRPRRP
jgi:Cyclic nucleotide-binding domain